MPVSNSRTEQAVNGQPVADDPIALAAAPEPRGMAVNPSFFFRIAPKERRGDENEESLCPKWFLASRLSSVMPM